MASYSLNLPIQLQQEAENLAAIQGISLDQFILWAVAEKVASLNQPADDPAFPNVIYRRGASGDLVPVLLSTGLRVQTIVIASTKWGFSVNQIADEYEVSEDLVREALGFYNAHRHQIDAAIKAEQIIEDANV